MSYGYPRMLGLSLRETLEWHSACRAGGGVFTEMLQEFLRKGLATAAAMETLSSRTDFRSDPLFPCLSEQFVESGHDDLTFVL